MCLLYSDSNIGLPNHETKIVKERRIREMAKLEKPVEQEWQDISPTLVKFENENDEFIGTLTKIDSVTVSKKEVKRAWFDTPQGPYVLLLTAQQEPVISPLPVGTLVKVVYTGTVKLEAGKKLKTFKIFVKPVPATA